jgi:uncharacterized metal-binding protein
MNEPNSSELPVIFTCLRNCENAQFANDLSKVMDMEGLAQRYTVVELAQADILRSCLQCSTKRCMAIDGCQLQCVKQALAQLEISPTWHIVLTDFSDNLSHQSPFNYAQMAKVLKTIQTLLTMPS